MDLYDTLRCEHPLPDGSTEREFQTKSLGGTLETYTLTSAHRWLEYEAEFTDGALQHLVPVAHATYTPEGTCLQPQRPRP